VPKKVYVTNKSGHNFQDALRFGDEIIYLSEGRVSPFAVNSLYRDFAEALRDSTPEDYLVMTSLPILSIIAASILARKHGRLNILIYREGKYCERNIMVDELL
jgi:hypothetical protein